MNVVLLLLVVGTMLEVVACQDTDKNPGCSGESVPCYTLPCSKEKCLKYPNASCTNDLCSCSAKFRVNQTDVTHECRCVDVPPYCPDGRQPVNCFVRPCLVEVCPKYPWATCRDDYCGGCHARFYVNGKEVTDDCCALTTTAGGCRDRWFLPNCTEVTRNCHKSYSYE